MYQATRGSTPKASTDKLMIARPIKTPLKPTIPNLIIRISILGLYQKNIMKPIDLTLVLALYNEGSTLIKSLETIYSLLEKSGLKFEIILIDDKSKDKTVFLAEDFTKEKENVILIKHEKNVGRGGAVGEGLKEGKGEVIGFIDVDLENSPDKMIEAVRLILSGQADVVSGQRIYKFERYSVIRYFASKGYHLLMKYILGLPLKDTEAGFKFFKREKIIPILNQVEDKHWFWDTEIMALSYYQGLKIKEIQIVFKRRLEKKSTVRVFSDSVNYLVKLIRFRFKKK